MRKAIIFTLSIIFLLLTFPFLISSKDFKLNQFKIASSKPAYAVLGMEVPLTQYIRSYYSFGLNNVLHGKYADPIDYSNREDFISYLWKRIPSVAIVYPTGDYYYYTVVLEDETIHGNLRFKSIDSGILSYGWFTEEENPEERESFTGNLSQDDGFIINKKKDNAYEVTYENKKITFYLNNNSSHNKYFSDSEKYITSIFDESGNIFSLILDKESKKFRYITEKLSDSKLEQCRNSLFMDNESRFLYKRYHDSYELVGVDMSSIGHNNYYDGPFDQMPPEIEIRDLFVEAGFNIDIESMNKYGEYVKRPNIRISISPYEKYENFICN